MSKVYLHRFSKPLPYPLAMEIQEELIKSVQIEGKNHLMILEHSPTITLGRREHGRTEGLDRIPSPIPIIKVFF